MTSWSPSSPVATKSWPPTMSSCTASSTVSGTPVFSVVRVTVNAAGVPSVTGEAPAAMETWGRSRSVVKPTLASAVAQALSAYAV